jgi:hypothetical protein
LEKNAKMALFNPCMKPLFEVVRKCHQGHTSAYVYTLINLIRMPRVIRVSG